MFCLMIVFDVHTTLDQNLSAALKFQPSAMWSVILGTSCHPFAHHVGNFFFVPMHLKTQAHQPCLKDQYSNNYGLLLIFSIEIHL